VNGCGHYWRGIGAGDWEAIGIGGGWPGERLDR